MLPTLAALEVIALPAQPDQALLLSLRVDEKVLAVALQRRFEQAWGDVADMDPRTTPSQTVTAATYAAWVGMGPGMVAPHLHTPLPFPLRQALIGLRVGAHKLEVQLGRLRGVRRHLRNCCVCEHTTPCVEDVAHFVLECPAYAGIRRRFAHLFFPVDLAEALPQRMRRVFCTPHQHALATCLHAMLEHRSAVLAAAGVRVRQ